MENKQKSLSIEEIIRKALNIDYITGTYQKNFKQGSRTKIMKNFKLFTLLYQFMLRNEDFSDIYPFVIINNFDRFVKFNYKKDQATNILDAVKNTIGHIILHRLGYGDAVSVYLANDQSVDMTSSVHCLTNDHYVRLFYLQTFIILYVLNSKYKLVHNDLKPDNVLVFKQSEPIRINLNGTKFVFNENYVFKLHDFDFSSCNIQENPTLGTNNSLHKLTIADDIHNLMFYSQYNYNKSIDMKTKYRYLFEEITNKLINKYCKICKNSYFSDNLIVHKIDKKFNNELLLDFITNSSLFDDWKVT